MQRTEPGFAGYTLLERRPDFFLCKAKPVTGLAGHPRYTTPASATSPDVSNECSNSILLPSMDAPDKSLDPNRIADLMNVDSENGLVAHRQERRHTRCQP